MAGNNDLILDVLREYGASDVTVGLANKRLHEGNATFSREMPLDGTYKMSESVEEGVDLIIYLSGKHIELRWLEDESEFAILVTEALEMAIHLTKILVKARAEEMKWAKQKLNTAS